MFGKTPCGPDWSAIATNGRGKVRSSDSKRDCRHSPRRMSDQRVGAWHKHRYKSKTLKAGIFDASYNITS
jgi:hypothetical protein